MTAERTSSPLPILLVVVLLIVGVIVLLPLLSSLAPAEMTVDHALRRGHAEAAYVSSQCNQSNHQLHMHHPGTNRDAYACFVDGQWGITIKGEPRDGDDVVTAFWRKKAQSLDDVQRYLIEKGYK